jgi:N-acetylglucosamine-6-phosphate deacetylase
MNSYVDLQVNGYAGVDFNADDLSDRELHDICSRLIKDGVQSILATIITAPAEQMLARVRRIAKFCREHLDASHVIAGFHIEGPFINPESGYVGAHPSRSTRRADQGFASQLIDASENRVKLVTLAPEMDPGAFVTRWLTEQHIVVAGGHSNASSAALKESIQAGLRMWTHLGNGCPMLLPRHDNIVQRVLGEADSLYISFIADSHHVPAVALNNYLKLVPHDRIVIVSDAIAAAGLGPGDYHLGGQCVHVDSQGAAWSQDRTHFAGCATTLHNMEQFLRSSIDATDADIQAWFCDNPTKVLKLAQIEN